MLRVFLRILLMLINPNANFVDLPLLPSQS